MSYVNYKGEPVALDPSKHARQKIKHVDTDGSHNGWRVTGIPPGALEEARKEHAMKASKARDSGKPSRDWDEAHWLMNAKRKPVRSKPYGVPQAAQECKTLAEKAGWLRVEIVELKKERTAIAVPA